MKTPDYISPDGTVTLIPGDCITGMRTLPDASVNCCVTSPPYWGLRDYGTAKWEGGAAGCEHAVGGQVQDSKAPGAITTGQRPGVDASKCRKCGARRIDEQLGLEATPDAYVAKMVDVFREVRRVLRDDGTLWLNLGDSYNAYNGNRGATHGANKGHLDIMPKLPQGAGLTVPTLKQKDLVGIPWRVAFALQQPFYTGRIRDERDRIWLAAMIEAEGCLFIHKRKAGASNGQGYERQSANYGPGLEVANTHRAIVERCKEITGLGSICSQSPEQNIGRKQTIHRWNLRTTECRDIIREVYPYFVAKQHQARLLCGCPSSGEQAERAHVSLKALHNGMAVDIDFAAPTSMFEQGWYLRQDIIWKKPNPMPESVTDRCTKAHEYIFLLSKSARYYFENKAIQEPAVSAGETRGGGLKYPDRTNDNGIGGAHNLHKYGETPDTRNKRSVWTVGTEPYPEAHFATYPPALIEPCILAGCPVDGVVLDPFAGSGTTGAVALKHGRRFVGCELNPEYVKLAEKRIGAVVSEQALFRQESAA